MIEHILVTNVTLKLMLMLLLQLSQVGDERPITLNPALMSVLSPG
jgi:hypothetical protein